MKHAEKVSVPDPVPMEIVPLQNHTRIGQNFGYIMYQNKIKCESITAGEILAVRGLKTKLRGRAHFYKDGRKISEPILLENEGLVKRIISRFKKNVGLRPTSKKLSRILKLMSQKESFHFSPMLKNHTSSYLQIFIF